MEAKWPFILLAFGLIFVIGLLLATMERTSVMNNWEERRCEIAIMMASRFFKPDSDPRTNDQFADDNFNFCVKSYVDKFMALFMAPINALFSKQSDVTGNALGIVNTIRKMAQTMYNEFSAYLASYFKKFNTSVFQLSRIIQHLRMAVNRMSAMAISMIYSGITLFRGMINSIQAVIRVILIICGIMIAIIIILFFVLFPFIPMIMTTLTAIVTLVIALSAVMSSSVVGDAQSKKGGFCFAESTQIMVRDTDGNIIKKLVKDIKIGDELGNDRGKVTTVLHMSGKEIKLYNLNGILVSGSHLVKGTDDIWKEVEQDERAIKTSNESSILYCFNTTTNMIPVYSADNHIINFRDWEELDNEDEIGQVIWNHLILTILNTRIKDTELYECIDNNEWKSAIGQTSEIPLVGKEYLVKTKNGFIPILTIKIGDKVINRFGKESEVLGIVKGEITDSNEKENKWSTGVYEWLNNQWKKSVNTMKIGENTIEGMYLITDSGEFTLLDEHENRERHVRDFTEIGYDSIHETYSFVASRLRITKHHLSR